MKTTLLLLFGFQLSMAQMSLDSITSGSVPTLLELEVSLTQFTYKERDAQLAAHNRTKTKPWKELLPSLGVGYTPGGSPRPTASWSPLQILDRKDRKNKINNDRESIMLGYEVILEDRLHKLQQLYADYLLDKRILASQRSTLLIDEELFAITERKYEENLIKPSEYLSAKRSIMASRSRVEVMALELSKLGNGVRYGGRW